MRTRFDRLLVLVACVGVVISAGASLLLMQEAPARCRMTAIASGTIEFAPTEGWHDCFSGEGEELRAFGKLSAVQPHIERQERGYLLDDAVRRLLIGLLATFTSVILLASIRWVSRGEK